MRILTLLLIGALQMSGLVAQVTEETTGSRLPAGFETRTLTIPDGRDLKYVVAEPKGFTSDQVVDVWIVMPTSTSPKKSKALDIAAATVSDYLAKQGKIAVMWPQAELGADQSAQGALLRSLHLKYRIRGSRLTVQAAQAGAAHAVTLLRAFPYDIGRMALYEPQFGDAVKSLILPSFSVIMLRRCPSLRMTVI